MIGQIFSRPKPATEKLGGICKLTGFCRILVYWNMSFSQLINQRHLVLTNPLLFFGALLHLCVFIILRNTAPSAIHHLFHDDLTI